MLRELIATMARTHACIARPARGGEWQYIIWQTREGGT